MKKVASAFVFFLVLAASQYSAQQKVNLPVFKSNIVIVRAVEQLGTLLTDGIYIADAAGTSHNVELSSLRAKNQAETLLKLSQVLNEVREQGYKLVSSNSGGSGSGGILVITNYIFQKE